MKLLQMEVSLNESICTIIIVLLRVFLFVIFNGAILSRVNLFILCDTTAGCVNQ